MKKNVVFIRNGKKISFLASPRDKEADRIRHKLNYIQKPFKDKVCKRCGATFTPKNARQMNCGSEKIVGSCSFLHGRELNLRNWLMNEYGITIEKFNSLFKEQGGKCKICGGKENFNKRLSVDHSHKTMKIRGLLCDKCNRGIGHFNDDVQILQKAIDYLKKGENL